MHGGSGESAVTAPPSPTYITPGLTPGAAPPLRELTEVTGLVEGWSGQLLDTYKAIPTVHAPGAGASISGDARRPEPFY